ncbi:hypothetical protein [Paraburkholderia bannensis]|uniref:hypothetical protein n=1 Tax=Paraburkholderia bannensis TaxID=765414 RepID=UPI000489BBB6|nr:hypothetical protein [Paraburkholderia bannensis]
MVYIPDRPGNKPETAAATRGAYLDADAQRALMRYLSQLAEDAIAGAMIAAPSLTDRDRPLGQRAEVLYREARRSRTRQT